METSQQNLRRNLDRLAKEQMDIKKNQNNLLLAATHTNEQFKAFQATTRKWIDTRTKSCALDPTIPTQSGINTPASIQMRYIKCLQVNLEGKMDKSQVTSAVAVRLDPVLIDQQELRKRLAHVELVFGNIYRTWFQTHQRQITLMAALLTENFPNVFPPNFQQYEHHPSQVAESLRNQVSDRIPGNVAQQYQSLSSFVTPLNDQTYTQDSGHALQTQGKTVSQSMLV
jgi:hypothetical protein